MFFKILINLSDKKFRKLKLKNLFENLTFYKNKKNWDVEIFTNDLVKDQFFISNQQFYKNKKTIKCYVTLKQYLWNINLKN